MSESSHNVELKNISRLREHELSAIVPDMRPEEWMAFVSDIKERRIQVPLEITKDGTVLDGRHRLRAARQLGITKVPTYVINLNGTPPEEYMVKAALLRRHLSDDQRAALALRWRERESKQAVADANEKRKGYGRGHKKSLDAVTKDFNRNTRTEAARLFAVSDKKMRFMVAIAKEKPELLPAIERGEVSLLEAKKDIRRNASANKIEALSKRNVPLNGKKQFAVIYADPPWRYDFPISGTRKVENHYPTMDESAIAALPVSKICADDCILFLWVPAPMLKKGLAVMEAWGFDYRTQMVWAKPSIGTGQWVRQKHENLLIGVRGSIPTPAPENKPESVVEAPRGRHSEKPEEFYSIIEGMYPGLARVELFAREQREGWDAWGNEV